MPPDYPFKPPAFMLLTPNGRFETGVKICLSISAHHPEHWQPIWSVRTALTALIAFMPTPADGALGSLVRTLVCKAQCLGTIAVLWPLSFLAHEVLRAHDIYAIMLLSDKGRMRLSCRRLMSDLRHCAICIWYQESAFLEHHCGYCTRAVKDDSLRNRTFQRKSGDAWPLDHGKRPPSLAVKPGNKSRSMFMSKCWPQAHILQCHKRSVSIAQSMNMELSG